jgi:hypothetical protein
MKKEKMFRRLNIVCCETIYQKIKELAEKECRSMAWVTRKLLEKSISVLEKSN